MARTAFYLLAIGATLGAISLALPGNSGRDFWASVAVTLAAYALAAITLIGFDRLPVVAFHGLAAGGTASVSAALFFGGESALAFSLFYFWVILYAGYFFSPRAAIAQLAFLFGCYAFVLFARPPLGLTAVTWLVSFGTIAVAGALVVALRRRVTGLLESERDASERLGALIEASPAAIVELDPNGRVRVWNHAAERMFGWRSDEVAGHDLQIVPDESLGAHGLLLAAAYELGHAEGELALVRRDGEQLAVSVAAAPVTDGADEVTGMLEILTDVTERQRLQDELQRAQKLEALGRLAGGIAHDVNNVLLAIKSEAWLLRDAIGEQGGEDELRSLEAVERAAERASALMRQLLAFSRKQMLRPRPLDLTAAVESLEEMLRRLLGDVVLFTDVEPVGTVRADPSQIEQVIANLVVNARDSMPDGGTVVVTTRDLGANVVLTVSDTGSGIRPEDREQIFDPFFTTKPGGEGTGLGLATVHGIVTQSGGHIEVGDRPGGGTVFSVFLPRTDELLDEEEHALPTPPERGSETILLVEDEAIVRKPMRRILEQQGYRVLEADHGGEALAVAERYGGPIDLLLTDVVMPSMSGPELAERIVERRPGLKVLYMSGYAEHAAALEAPAGSLLQKPFPPQLLARRIRELLAV